MFSHQLLGLKSKSLDLQGLSVTFICELMDMWVPWKMAESSVWQGQSWLLPCLHVTMCLFIWVLVEQRGGWSADGAAAFRSCVNLVYWKASCYWEWKHGLTTAVLSFHLCSLFDCSNPSKGLWFRLSFAVHNCSAATWGFPVSFFLFPTKMASVGRFYPIHYQWMLL